MRQKLPEDWAARYNVEPVLIETFVERRVTPEPSTEPPAGNSWEPHRAAVAMTPNESSTNPRKTSGSEHSGETGNVSSTGNLLTKQSPPRRTVTAD